MTTPNFAGSVITARCPCGERIPLNERIANAPLHNVPFVTWQEHGCNIMPRTVKS